MSSDQVQERVFAIVADVMGADVHQLTPETSIIEDLGANDMNVAELIIDWEDDFHVAILDDDIPSICTLGQAVEYIRTLLSHTVSSAA